jgi:hypothetical protein
VSVPTPDRKIPREICIWKSKKSLRIGVFLFELYFVAHGVQAAPTIIDIVAKTIYSHSIEFGKLCLMT